MAAAVGISDKIELLKAEGWNLCSVKVSGEIEEFDKLSSKAALEELKNSDLKNIGVASFPEDISKAGKLDRLDGPLVTQVQKVRNVAAPKANEDSQAAPRMLKLTLTDGVSSVNALEMETINHVSLNTPPGTKVQLLGNIPVRQGYLEIGPGNVQVLGGSVLKLIEKWEANRVVEMTGRVYTGQEGGPPPFIGFGKQRTSSSGQVDTSRPAFPSTGGAAGGEGRRDGGSHEDKDPTTTMFEQQRDEALQEAMKAKAAEPKKSFGGSKTWMKPPPVQPTGEITSLMVIPAQTPTSDKKSGEEDRYRQGGGGGSIAAKSGFRRDSDWPMQSPSSGMPDASGEPHRGGKSGRGRGGRGGGRGAYQRGEAGSDFGGGGEDGRPSGPATLFDFLETKIPTKPVDGTTNMNNNKAAPNKSVPFKSHGNPTNDNSNKKSQGLDHVGGTERLATSASNAAMGNLETNPDGGGIVDLSVSQFPPPPSASNVGSFVQPLTGKKSPSKSAIPPLGKNLQMVSQQPQPMAEYRGAGENSAGNDGDDITKEMVHGERNTDNPADNQGRSNNGFYSKATAELRINGAINKEGGGVAELLPRSESFEGSSMTKNTNKNGEQSATASEKPVALPIVKLDLKSGDASSTLGQKGRRENFDENKMRPYINRGPPPSIPSSLMRPFPPSKLGPHFPPHPPPSFRTPMGSPKIVCTGDAVLAKYWEDGNYYVAIINQLGKTTAIVTFLEPYGNTEEVYLSDLMTFDGHPVMAAVGGATGPGNRMLGGRRRPNGVGSDNRSPPSQAPPSSNPPSLIPNAPMGPLMPTQSRPNQAQQHQGQPQVKEQWPSPPKPKSGGGPRQFLLPDVHQPPPNFSGPPPMPASNTAPSVASTASSGPPQQKPRESSSTAIGDAGSSLTNSSVTSGPPPGPPPLIQPPTQIPPPLSSQPTPLLPGLLEQESKPKLSQPLVQPRLPSPSVLPSQNLQSGIVPPPTQQPSLQQQSVSQQQQSISNTQHQPTLPNHLQQSSLMSRHQAQAPPNQPHSNQQASLQNQSLPQSLSNQQHSHQLASQQQSQQPTIQQQPPQSLPNQQQPPQSLPNQQQPPIQNLSNQQQQQSLSKQLQPQSLSNQQQPQSLSNQQQPQSLSNQQQPHSLPNQHQPTSLPNQQQVPPTSGSIPPAPTSVPPPPFNPPTMASSSSNLSPSMSIPPQSMMTSSYPPPPHPPHSSLQFTPPAASMATLPPEFSGSYMQGMPPGCSMPVPTWMPNHGSGMDFYGTNPNAVSLQQSPFTMTSLASSLPHHSAFSAAQHSFPVRVNAHHPALVGAPSGPFPPPPPIPTTPTLSGAPLTSQPAPLPGAVSVEEFLPPPAPRLATAPAGPPRPQQMFQPVYPSMAQVNTTTTAVFK